ncbi:MAG: type II CAAX endopeptidase family protein [Acidimicrobiia bacterium]|nr:type II CAAX endopeptidase family protein [Acidimicrobiia bacterium]
MESSAPPQPPQGYLPVANWSYGQLILVFVAGLAGSLIASIGLTIAGADIFDPLPFSIVFMAQTGASFAVIVWLSRTKGSGSLAADFGLVIKPSSWWGVPAGMGLQIVIALLTAPFVIWIFGDDPPEQGVSEVAGSTETVLEQILVILAIAVAAPIIEEVIYRGMLLSTLRRRFSAWPSILISAFIFAVIHAVLDPNAIAVVPGLFLLGIVLAYAALRTGDLSLSIALHSGINLLAALSLLYGDSVREWAENQLEEMEAVILFLGSTTGLF